MRNLLSTLILLVLFIPDGNSQNQKISYGKVTKNEIEINSYPEDSTANAFILSEKIVTYYKYENERFKLYTDRLVKVKVLNQDGADEANITIPYYCGKNSTSASDDIFQIKACSYNLENGKINKTNMEKKYVFEERVSPYWKQIKFSIPNVKAGSVFEYQYLQMSELYHLIPDMNLQHDIPVKEGYYEVRIPLIFDFNVSYKKNFPFTFDEKVVTESFDVATSSHYGAPKSRITVNTRKIVFTSQHMPALKEEPYSWCEDDFRATIGFELKGTQNGDNYKSYTSTWEDIDKEILKEYEFEKSLAMPNPYQDKLKAMPTSEIKSQEERVALGFKLLKSQMVWNGKYAISPKPTDITKAVQAGTGNNAEMNFILISILRDLGIKSYPILLSRREMGRLPMIFPTISKLNTFIVRAELADSTQIYLDASMNTANLNILPSTFMVENARKLTTFGANEWIDLTKVGNNTLTQQIDSKINEDGTIEGNIINRARGHFAANYRDLYHNQKDAEGVSGWYENKYEIELSDYDVKGVEEPFQDINETFTFKKKVPSDNDLIYIDPIIFPHIKNNPFTQTKRQLPIEMDYPYVVFIISKIEIPENYQIEETPQMGRFSFDENGITCLYTVLKQDNIITLNYRFTLKKLFYQKDQYEDLSAFFGSIVTKNTEMIILKRK